MSQWKKTSTARNELALSLQPKLALQVVKYVKGVFPLVPGTGSIRNLHLNE